MKLQDTLCQENDTNEQKRFLLKSQFETEGKNFDIVLMVKLPKKTKNFSQRNM
jgi:hypothetical protein